MESEDLDWYVGLGVSLEMPDTPLISIRLDGHTVITAPQVVEYMANELIAAMYAADLFGQLQQYYIHHGADPTEAAIRVREFSDFIEERKAHNDNKQ